MNDESFNSLAGRFAQGLGSAEIDGVGLDAVGIELVLADHLAEAVADLGATVISVLAVGIVSVLSNFTPSAEWLKATQSMTG